MRRTLEAHGDQIVAEHASIDALTAVVHGDDLAALAARTASCRFRPTPWSARAAACSAACSAASSAGCVGGVVNTLGVVVGGVVGIVDPTTNTEGPAVPPQVLRETLGLGSTLAGRGVGVAVIDSGLEMSRTSRAASRRSTTSPAARRCRRTRSTTTVTARTSRAPSARRARNSNNREYRGLAPNVKFSCSRCSTPTAPATRAT